MRIDSGRLWCATSLATLLLLTTGACGDAGDGPAGPDVTGGDVASSDALATDTHESPADTSHVDATAPLDGESCTPTCDGLNCGDDGCGGSCGTCDTGDVCTDGVCTTPCAPACDGLICGDDGCGGSCGTCDSGDVCTDGVCTTPCAPACDGKTCGDDGCGGSCGTCDTGDVCTLGVCTTPCAPACDGLSCGDDGCGGTCGTCDAGDVCTLGVCTTPCAPACDGLNCGDDGCGGSCGSCDTGDVCSAGVCTTPCAPACDGLNCGDDGCGGSCGTCDTGDVCTLGVCTTPCTPVCDGKQCGDDGCGGSCGDCATSFVCEANQCESPVDHVPTTTSTISPRYVAPGDAATLIVDVTDLNSDLDLSIDDVVAVRVDLSAVTGEEDEIVDLLAGDASGRQSRVFTAALDTTGLDFGAYPLRVTATDAGGNEAHDTVALVVYSGTVVTVGPSGDHTTIKSAVAAANAGDWVQVAPGTYTGNLNKNVVLSGKEVLIASTGTAADTIVDCEGAGRVFNVTDAAPAHAIIAGLTLTKCGAAAVRVVGELVDVPLHVSVVECALTHNGNSDPGGAVQVSGVVSGASLYDVRVTDSTHSARGGGLAVESGAVVSCDDCVFARNQGSYAQAIALQTGATLRVHGGSIEDHDSGNAAISLNRATVEMELTRVVRNLGGVLVATSIYQDKATAILNRVDVRENGGYSASGAVFQLYHADLTVDHSTFTENAGRCIESRENGAIIVRDTTFGDNDGGGILYSAPYTPAGASLLVQRTVFRNNNATRGGAIWASSQRSMSVQDSVFLYNSANMGGALNLSATCHVANSIFVGNTAEEGGAIAMYNSSPASTIAHTTFVDNVAAEGGGVYVSQGKLDVRSSVFDGSILTARSVSSVFLTVADTLLADEDVIDDGLRINGGDGYYTGGNGNIAGPVVFTSGPRGDYYLSQTSAGQAITSPGVDPPGSPLVTATPAVQGRTTRTDGVVDSGTVDMGYHYWP